VVGGGLNSRRFLLLSASDRTERVNRTDMLAAASDRSVVWDLVVIGGGASWLGVAVDAASRGYRTLLLEREDFGSATSSRSTKLIHGGVRYLQQGNIKLVREALHERGLLLRNASHLVHPLRFIIPHATPWDRLFYGTGLKIYDAMSGHYGLAKTQHLSAKQTLEALPTLKPERTVGGTAYVDGQFDDARLAITLVLTAADHGGVLLNYAAVTAFEKQGTGRINAVLARDLESGQELRLQTRAVINATGVFADEVRKLDDPALPSSLSPSQGAHIVLPRKFLPGDAALMIPKTDDGRVLFAIPWQGRVILGTTDTPVEKVEAAPRALDSEIEFLLHHAARYLTTAPTIADVLCIFAGLRPLAKISTAKQTALVPRDHHIEVAPSGLVTITGGKWTTYRRMAKDVLDRAAEVAALPPMPCRTDNLPLHGSPSPEQPEALGKTAHGSDQPALQKLASDRPEWSGLLHPAFPYLIAEVVWSVRQEMARTVEDILARRTRALFLDVRAALQAAPAVASLLAKELGRSTEWAAEQSLAFERLAHRYL